MNDNELLRLAAIAGGYGHLDFIDDFNGGKTGHGTEGDILNPLTDDGDALKLLVNAKLNLEYVRDVDGSRFVVCHNGWCPKYVDGTRVVITHENGVHAATRRAIVLAAAQIALRRYDDML